MRCLHDFENSYAPEQFLLRFFMFPQPQALLLSGEVVSLFWVWLGFFFFENSLRSLGQECC